jgi:hypothetical protein
MKEPELFSKSKNVLTKNKNSFMLNMYLLKKYLEKKLLNLLKREVLMKRYILIIVYFLLIFFALFSESVWADETQLSKERWGSDIRIGGRDSVNAVALDVDYSNGNLFAALRNTEGGNNFWTAYISTDTGQTWTETTGGLVGPGIVDVDAAVLNDYFYVVYAIGNRALIRRFRTDNGNWDVTYGTDTVTSGGANVREIALVSEEDASSPQRLYCFAILNDNSLRFFNSDTTITSWGTFALGITNADRGLDACYNEGYSSRYAWCSYFGTNDSVYIEGVGLFMSYSYGPLTDVLYPIDVFSITSIGAYRDTVMVLYPYVFSEFGCAINSCVSYNGGSSWEYEGTVFVSSLTMGAGDITARKGDGFGVVITDLNFGLYTHRDYTPGEWSDTVHFTNPGMTAYRIKPSIERIATNSYGIIYVDHPAQGAWFDISQWPSGIEEKSYDQILLSAAPSLFSSLTSIEYSLPTQQNIYLDIYDILGNHVINLISGEVTAGENSITWDGRDDSGNTVASGMYFCVLKTNEKENISTKITFIK